MRRITDRTRAGHYILSINASKLSIAVAFTTLTAWILCSLAVAVFPELTMTITGHLFHMPTDAFDWSLNWSRFAMGAICWTGFAFLFTWGAAATYNRLTSAGAESRSTA